jgi:hypothetical protein
LPQYAEISRDAARPLGPGEYVVNADGSWSNELTATVRDRALNAGRWTVVPTLWYEGGYVLRVTPHNAALLAIASGLQW